MYGILDIIFYIKRTLSIKKHTYHLFRMTFTKNLKSTASKLIICTHADFSYSIPYLVLYVKKQTELLVSQEKCREITKQCFKRFFFLITETAQLTGLP